MPGDNTRFIQLVEDLRSAIQQAYPYLSNGGMPNLSVEEGKDHPEVLALVKRIRSASAKLSTQIETIKKFEKPVDVSTLITTLDSVADKLEAVQLKLEPIAEAGGGYDSQTAGTDPTAQVKFSELRDGLIPQLETVVAEVQTNLLAESDAPAKPEVTGKKEV